MHCIFAVHLFLFNTLGQLFLIVHHYTIHKNFVCVDEGDLASQMRRYTPSVTLT